MRAAVPAATRPQPYPGWGHSHPCAPCAPSPALPGDREDQQTLPRGTWLWELSPFIILRISGIPRTSDIPGISDVLSRLKQHLDTPQGKTHLQNLRAA